MMLPETLEKHDDDRLQKLNYTAWNLIIADTVTHVKILNKDMYLAHDETVN